VELVIFLKRRNWSFFAASETRDLPKTASSGRKAQFNSFCHACDWRVMMS